MSNIFSMVTVQRSNTYTNYALESFFKNTELNENDEFFLIDNDGCELEQYSSYKKIQIIKNKFPLSIARNINQIIDKALKYKKNLVFLNNDIIFTKNWFHPLQSNSKDISIPVNNQIFPYKSDCENLKLDVTMNLKDFNENYLLLNNIVEKHKKKFKLNLKFQALLMPFFCFKVPNHILNEVGYFDTSFVHGAEDVDYRIRSVIKGYDVNFLLDSYLLHFHGKSSWDGGETISEVRERDKKYTEAFLKKWGSEMTKIFILRKNFFEILEEKGLNEIYKKRKFSELIKRLLK